MKKNRLFVSMLAAGLLTIAPAMAQDIVKLTTSKAAGETVSLQLNQLSKGATVDWGDGTAEEVKASGETSLTITGTLKGSTITISSDSKIRTLICPSLELTAIDVTGATNLMSLYCQDNKLTSLNISKNTALTDLNCANNELTSLTLTATTHPSIENINVAGNSLKNLSGSGTSFSVAAKNLQHVNISQNNFSTASFTSANSEIDELRCAGNNISALTLLNIDSLSVLDCRNNRVKTITIGTKTAALRHVFAGSNQLSKLDVSAAETLQYLSIKDNKVATLGLPQATKIYAVECGDNALLVSELPAKAYVSNISYLPQDATLNVYSALTKDATSGTYYTLIPPKASQAKEEPYKRDFSNWFYDGSGTRTINFTFNGIPAGETESVELKKSTHYTTWSSAGNYGWYAFRKALNDITLTITSDDYPELSNTSGVFYAVNSVDELPTGINDIVADQKGTFSAKAVSGNLVITTPSAQAVRVYNTSGKVVWQGQVDGTQTITLPGGVYIVGPHKVVL